MHEDESLCGVIYPACAAPPPALTLERLRAEVAEAQAAAQADKATFLRALGFVVPPQAEPWNRAVMPRRTWMACAPRAGLSPEPPAWLMLSDHLPEERVFVWWASSDGSP